MSWDDKTKSFTPPPPLADICSGVDDAKLVCELMDFTFYKSTIQKQPLTPFEKAFNDVCFLLANIDCDGWHSVFYQAYTYDAIGRMIDLLNEAGATHLAKQLYEARTHYYLGRSDLMTRQELEAAGMTGWHMPPEVENKFYEIGDAVSAKDSQIYQLGTFLAKPARKHLKEFTEFVRNAEPQPPRP